MQNHNMRSTEPNSFNNKIYNRIWFCDFMNVYIFLIIRNVFKSMQFIIDQLYLSEVV